MTVLLLMLFWLSIALLAWVYTGYPLVALVFSRARPARRSRAQGAPQLVTVGIAVHNGEGVIAGRIADVLAQSAPFPIELVVASDGSTDETVAILRAVADREPRVRLLDLDRRGQAAAQAAIFEAARGEIVVLTDSETRFAPGCLAELVGPLGAEQVGCVTGVLHWHYDMHTHVARDESLYWRYEQAVRRYESDAGWLSAATGALLAVRRTLFRPVPPHASLDQMLPLLAKENGLLVLVAPDAIGSDRGTVSLDAQYRSRVRIATQGIEVNLRMALRLASLRRPGHPARHPVAQAAALGHATAGRARRGDGPCSTVRRGVVALSPASRRNDRRLGAGGRRLRDPRIAPPPAADGLSAHVRGRQPCLQRSVAQRPGSPPSGRVGEWLMLTPCGSLSRHARRST